MQSVSYITVIALLASELNANCWSGPAISSKLSISDSALHLPRCLTLITVAGLLTKYPGASPLDNLVHLKPSQEIIRCNS